MKTVKIKFSDFTTCNTDDFINRAAGTVEALSDNTDVFPTPPVATTEMETEIEELISLNALADSDSGSHNSRNERDSQRNTVFEKVMLNGLYVLGIANTKETYEQKTAVVELASYPVANETHNPTEVVPITGLVVKTPGIPGIRTVDVRYKKGQAAACLIQGTQSDPFSPNATWTDLKVNTTSKCTLTLAPGAWAIRVVGLYTTGQANPSAIVTVTVG